MFENVKGLHARSFLLILRQKKGVLQNMEYYNFVKDKKLSKNERKS